LETGIKKAALYRILSDITKSQIDSSAMLVMPEQVAITSDELHRPELELFDLRKEQLSAGLKIISSKRMPKAYGFATFGYGNPPGSNFFRNEFAPYYIVGAGIKWNIFDWDRSKNDRQVIGLQEEIIEGRKKDLTDNLKRMLETKKAEIRSFESLIDKDAEMISLRKKITAAAESQYINGTITATDYLNELNSEQQVMINHEIHKINLSMSIIEYINISGKEIE
jgi:outer membrane protein TolC